MAQVLSEHTPLLVGNLSPNKSVRDGGGDNEKCSSRLKRIAASCMIEPVIFLYSLCYGLEAVFATNLLLDKVCKDSYRAEVCKDLDSGNHTVEQDAVQRLTNKYQLYFRLIEYIPGIFVLLLLGAWSDQRDRKWPILISLIGQVLKAAILTANSYWWYLKPQFLLLAYVPLGLSGTTLGLHTGAYAYISAMTGGKSRTSRLALVAVLLHAISPCGQALAEVLFRYGGYVAIYGTYFLLVSLSLLYAVLRLDKWPDGRPEGASGSVWQALSPKTLQATVLVVFRFRKNGVRGDLLGFIFVVALYVFGAETKIYNFLYCRKKFSWEYEDFTTWSIVNTPLMATGTLLVVPTLSYLFRVEDAMLGFIGGVSSLFCYVIRGTAMVPWVMYLSSFVGLCSEMTSVSSRGAISKLVDPVELGAVFAILAMGEAIIPIVSPSVYTAIYNSTIDYFPGLIFIVASAMSCSILVILVWIMTRRVSKGIYKEVTPIKKK